MSKKLHIVDRAALIRSVLLEVPVAAVCGVVKVFTREDVESAATTGREACKGCALGCLADHQKGDVVIGKSAGWTALIEADLKERLSRKQSTWTIATSGITPWTFPPAA